jgi:hypothetical protein
MNHETHPDHNLIDSIEWVIKLWVLLETSHRIRLAKSSGQVEFPWQYLALPGVDKMNLGKRD